MRKNSSHFLIVIPIAIFSILFIPFLNTIPCGNRVEPYMQAVSFYTDGLMTFLQKRFVYPPAISMLPSVFFKFLGVSVFSYNLLGYSFGILGIIGVYYLCRYIFPQKKGAPLISALLLCTFPTFISNGVNPTDYYLVTILCILCFLFYSKNKINMYAITSSLAVLTKDIALLLPFSIIAIDSMYAFRKNVFNKQYLLSRLPFLIVPFFVYFLWFFVVRSNGANVWHENFYGDTRYNEIFYNSIYNTLTFNFFNEVAVRHVPFLLYLNFNWVYWLIAGLGFIYLVRITKIDKSTIVNPTTLSILLFCVLYIYVILIAETEPIPGQNLPIMPYLIIMASLPIATFTGKNMHRVILASIVFTVFTFLHLFYPKDPISTIIWDQKMVNEQRVYYLSKINKKENFLVYHMYPICSPFK